MALSGTLLSFAMAAEWFSFQMTWFAPPNVARFRTNIIDSHLNTVWCWASATQLGNQRVRHTVVEAGRFFLSAKLYKKKKVLIKNKQKIPQTHKKKKICTHFTVKTYLVTPKTEAVRRYLYFKTSLVTLLTIT